MTRTVLILGGGFGGMTIARRLERILAATSAKIVLVNDTNYMLYAPLLPGGGRRDRAAPRAHCPYACDSALRSGPVTEAAHSSFRLRLR